ncbi:MAG: glycine--tRNA ligase [Patescibacteria group bacterium]
MAKSKTENKLGLMDKIVSLAKRRGFIFPGSEIYGGLANSWDYGPLGVELKNNVKRAWWRSIVMERDDVVGIDAAIIMHPKVWEASGHVSSFSDPLIECKNCHERFREDHLYEGKYGEIKTEHGKPLCPKCGGEMTESKKFNLMFKTSIGPVEDSAHQVYLRPETAQAMFVDFKEVLNTTRKKIPFGIAQIGKAFRNEITPGNFTFRTREFEQMELEYFVEPGTDKKWHQYWLKERIAWYVKYGISKKNLRLRAHGKEELSHYSAGTSDVEYTFPWGWGELEGIANRTNFDLSQHSKYSGQDLSYFDEEKKKKFIPYVIEPSAGADRSVLAFMMDAYKEEEDKDGRARVVLKIHPQLASYKVAVFPLLANKPQLAKLARKIYDDLKKQFMTAWDDRGNIGKRYYSQDEIGTPWCVTIDFESLKDKKVTVRDRDSMKQKRVPIKELSEYFRERLENYV